MSEELDVLLMVADRLETAGVPYMLSGSTAMNVYAEPRMTRDIDIVVELGPAHVDAIAAVFAADFYCDRDMIAQAVQHQSSFNVIHTPTVIKVDCIVRKDTPYRRVEFARRRPIVVDEHAIQVVAPEDLVLSKLVWAKPSHSEVQLRDVRNLLACVPDLDWSYLDRWAIELEVTELLREVRA
jgi:hypothetical protein